MPVFATLAQLAAALRAQAAATGQIVLSQATMWGSDTRIPELLQGELGRPDLTLVVAASGIPADPGPTLRFQVATPTAPSDRFLGLVGVTGLTITFDLAPTTSEVNFTLAIPLPKGWTLATGWTQLYSDAVAAGLGFTDGTLTIDTHPDAKAVSFRGTLGLGNDGTGLDLIGRLLPGTKPSITVEGTITPGPAFDLRVPLLPSAPPPLAGLVKIGPPYFSVRSLEVHRDGDPDGPSYVVTQWLVGADVELGGGAATLTLAAIPQPPNGFVLAVMSATPEGTSVEALVTALLNGTGLSQGSFSELFGSVPFAQKFVHDLLDAFAFKGFFAAVGLGPGGISVPYLAVDVGSTLERNGQPKYKFPIIPDVLVVDRFDVQWLIFEPFGHRTMTVAIRADLTFATGYPFQLEIAVPGFMVTGRYTGPPVTLSLAQVEQELFHGEIDIPLGFEVTFTGLELEISPPNSYTMTIEAGAEIELFGTRLLSITDGNLTVARAYATSPTTALKTTTVRFYGTIGLGPLEFAVTAQVGTGLDTIFSIHTVGQTLGGLLTQLVRLIDPYLDLRLEPPWDFLDTVDLDQLLLTVNVTRGLITLEYPIGLNLGFVTIDSIGLRYQRAQPGGIPADIQIELECTFLGVAYGGAQNQPPLAWNPVTDRAPTVPGAGASLFDVQYVAIGQHVTVDGDLRTIADIFKALRGTAVPLSPGTSDPSKLPGVRFDAGRDWLIATQFSVMGAISVSGVFNDPTLAGLRIALAGEKVAAFAGLEFEILYTRVTPTVGLYHVELKLPDAMRHLEFGAVSVTLPVVVVDIYTNGNFRIDFGFPKGLDFSRSFCIQAFPFVGYGGFYFALLDGQTSRRVPRVTNGQFTPVIEFGMALSLGVGKTIDEGVFSAGATLTVVGIVEGVIGWFEPSGTDVGTDRYYWIQGTVALTGQVFGKVDFAIISVDVRIAAQATVTLTIEAYQPIHVALVARVSVQASLKILFIRIHFTFSLTLNLAFTIGSASTPPWQLASGGGGSKAGVPALAAQDASRPTNRPVHLAIHRSRREFLGLELPAAAASASPLDFTARSVAHLLAGAAPTLQGLDITLVPAFTRGDGGGPVQCVLLPFIENSIPPEAHALADVATVGTAGADAGFNQLATRMFAWVVGALGVHIDGPSAIVTADDLRQVAAVLYGPTIENGPLSYANLRAFLTENFVFRIYARTPDDESQRSATVFPMLPDLTLTTAGTETDFATHTPVDPAYQQAIDAYLQQLEVAYENDVEARAGGGGAGARAAARARAAAANQSMAELVFGNWFTMLARSAVDAAIAIARAYPFVVPATGVSDLAGVAASFPAATAVLVCATGDTLDAVAARCDCTVAAIRALNPDLPHVTDDGPLPVGYHLNVPVLVTPASIVATNTATPALLSTSKPLPLGGVQYQVRSGDTFASIAGAFAAIPQLHTDVKAMTTQLLTANAAAAVLQPGTSIELANPPAYRCQAGDTPAIVAATYLVRGAGRAVLNQLGNLASTVDQLRAANPGFTANQLIPDGTTLVLPAELGGGTRTARLGETLTRLAATLLAATDKTVGLMQMVRSFAALNWQLPTDPDGPLPSGTTTLEVPSVIATMDPGESLDDIAVAFGEPSGASVGADLTATPGLLAVGAILQLGPLHWQPTTTDSFGSIMGELNLTVDELTDSIATVEGSLVPGTTLTVPQVPALPLAQFQQQLLIGGRLNTAAASISRFLLHGLRLPTPAHAGITDALSLAAAATAGVFGLVGQQFAVNTADDLALAPGTGVTSPPELRMGGYTTKTGDTLKDVADRFARPGESTVLQSLIRVMNGQVPDWTPPLPAGTHLYFPGATAYDTLVGEDVYSVVSRFCQTDGLAFLGQLRYLNPTVDLDQNPLPTGTHLVLPTAVSTTTVLGETPEAVAARFVAAGDQDGMTEFLDRLIEENPSLQRGVVIPPDTVLAVPRTFRNLALGVIDLQWSSDELAVIAALQQQSFDVASTVHRLPLYRIVPQRWSLSQVLHWQAAVRPTGTRFSGGPAAGEPTIWPFPAALRQVLAASMPEPVLELVTARSDSPADAAGTEPVAGYAWATAITFGIRLVDGVDGPLPNTYQVAGADQAGRDQLELLWHYLGTTTGSVTAMLLYAPSPTSGNPAGLMSDALAGSATFVVQANLSTVSTSGAAASSTTPSTLVHSAELTDARTFCQLLWECSVVHGGGYYLQYATATGAGLPAQLFRQGAESSLTLLVLVDEGVAPPAPPPVQAVHNCAVVTSNIQAGSTQLFVQPVLHTARAGDSVDDVVAAIAEAHGVETTTDAVLAANQPNLAIDGAGAFRPGTQVLAGPAPTNRVADAPAGNTGFELTRPDPGADADPSGVDSLFQLLAFAIAEAGGFRASPQGLPAGPAGSDADGGVGNGTWDYRALLPVARYAADGLPADPPTPFRWTLPSPWLDPYRGVAPGSRVTIDLQFRDVYGNAAGGKGVLAPLEIPVGYFDDLIALSAWPSVAADFAFGPGSPPKLELDVGFDPSHYVAGPGLAAGAAARAAAVHRARFAQIAYQLRQTGITAVLRSSLDQTGTTQKPYPLDVGRLRAFALSIHAFLRAAEDLVAHQCLVATGDTLAALARRFMVAVSDLADANAEVDAAHLFATPSLQIPVFRSFRHGGSLHTLGVTAPQVVAASLDLPLTPGVDLSLASQPGSYVLTGTPTPSLRQIAEATKAGTGGIATANAQHPLSSGLTLVADGVTLTTGSGGTDTLATMVERFAHLDPPVPTTAADLGTANQDVAGLFDASSSATLTITDRVVAGTETLRSITSGGQGAPKVAELVADNLTTVDLFPPGSAIWASNQTYQLQSGDTLGGVAARFGVDLATLAGLAANADAPLTAQHEVHVTIPGQVVFGSDGPRPRATMLDRPVVADDIASNWYTADLFVAGSLRVGTIDLTAGPRDLPATLYDQARSKGYPGTPVEFNTALATALATSQPTVLDPSGMWLVAPLTVGPTRTLQATAAAAGVDVDLLVRSNGSLRGLLRAGATVRYPASDPTTITLTADDTLGTLAARFTAAGVPMTLEDLASHTEITGADILVEQANAVGPAMVLHETVPFTGSPQNPELIFAVTMTLELARPTDRVDPDFAEEAGVVLAGSAIAPRAAPGDDATRTLQAFAADFEAAFPGLKAAVSQRQQGVAETPDAGQLWTVDMRADGGLGYSVSPGATAATYFALPPLSTDLLSYSDVAIQPYVSGQPLGPAVSHSFRSIDIDAWLDQFLTAVDAFLSASSAPAARFLSPTLLDEVIADKQRIAAAIATRVTRIFTDGPAGDAAQAQAALEQAMLVSLSAATSVNAIVQVPVTVRAPARVDPNLAPRLSGVPVPRAASETGAADAAEPSPYSLSTAKVPLADGTQPLTFTVSVKQPAADRTLDVDLRYAVTEIEHSISDVNGIADYQRSSWLTLLRPASLEPDGVIGPIEVPVPLRAAPAPPTMVEQSATSSMAKIGVPPLDQVKRWDYTFSFDHPTADQDTRYLKVSFNAPAAAGAGLGQRRNLDAVFARLAQFISVYPALQADLGLLPQLGVGTANSTIANAVAVFARLVGDVADALALADVTSEGPADLPGIVLDYTVTVDGDVMTLTLPKGPPPATIGWPDVSAAGVPLVGQPVGPTDAARHYQFPAKVPTTTSRYEWAYRSLDVTLLQRAVSAMWVVRNQNLGGPVAAAFVYRTAVAEFASPVVPLLVSQMSVPIGGTGSQRTVAQALIDAFTGLFGTEDWSADIKLGARYGYSLAGDPSMVAMLPVFLFSRLTTNAAGVPGLAAEAQRHIDHFTSTWDPNPDNGHFIFDLTVYAAQPPKSGLAVLDVQNLEYALSAG